VDQAGVVHESDDRLAGEVFDLGPVALSLEDIEASGWGDGYNVVIHEMAHKIDGRDGILDGCPPLHPDMDGAAWTLSFREAYEDLLENVERSPSGRSRIDGYAARSPDEFFAVACEYFYEKPALLRSEYPAVYGQLVRSNGATPG
jgi:Mlc titration factor MtfA (ptsG expression regulator)